MVASLRPGIPGCMLWLSFKCVGTRNFRARTPGVDLIFLVLSLLSLSLTCFQASSGPSSRPRASRPTLACSRSANRASCSPQQSQPETWTAWPSCFPPCPRPRSQDASSCRCSAKRAQHSPGRASCHGETHLQEQSLAERSCTFHPPPVCSSPARCFAQAPTSPSCVVPCPSPLLLLPCAAVPLTAQPVQRPTLAVWAATVLFGSSQPAYRLHGLRQGHTPPPLFEESKNSTPGCSTIDQK
jgi:hypothetical protein